MIKNKDNIESRYSVDDKFKNFLLVKDLIIKERLIVARAENCRLK